MRVAQIATLWVAFQALSTSMADKLYASVNEFPLPENGSFVADPHGILSESSRIALQEKIRASCDNLVVRVKDKNDVEQSFPVQLAVAIVERLKTDAAINDDDVDKIVENFARQLHDKWGVGYETEKGGTGILVFLDVYDRVVYISKGGALERILTNYRLDNILQEIKSPLRQANYAVGLMQAVEMLVDYVERGVPGWMEHVFRVDNILIFGLAVAFISVFFAKQQKNREQREYAKVASQLTALDRAQAQALQGNYQPQTTCPICMEDFESGSSGSDGEPIKLLRCGHIFDESCWSEWVTSGRGDVTKCPVCRMDVGPQSIVSHDMTTVMRTRGGAIGNASNAYTIATPTVDRFVEENDFPDQQQAFIDRNQRHNPSNTVLNMDTHFDADRDRALRLYQQERNFRLMRLSSMYPRYMTPDQVTRLSSPAYHGQMARDRPFVERDPNLTNQSSVGRGSFSSGGFGGGASSGGRSGRF